MVIFVFLGLVVWNARAKSIRKQQELSISNIIDNTIQEQTKKGLLLPKIVFINSDSSSGKELSDTLIKQIAQTLTNRYLANDTTKFSNLDLKPFFVLPNKPNKNGNYILTDAQLNDLKEHLDFLTKQVDIEVDKAKEEIGRDIDRLNNWVTIWIGVIGFLGIFIPVIINIDTSRNAEKASEKSDAAYNKSEEALTKINTAEPQIKKIDGIEEQITSSERRIGEIEKLAGAAEGKANEANKNAEIAKSKSDALHLVYAIDKLDSVEPENIQYVDRNEWIPLLKKTLISIRQSLDDCKMQHDGDIIKDSLAKMIVRLSRVSFHKFMHNDNTKIINEYLGFVTDTMINNYSQENFEKIISGLEQLANNLKNDLTDKQQV